MMKVTIYGNLEEVVRQLIEYRMAGYDVYCEFNGYILYSRDITLDKAYLEVTGMTYLEFKRLRKRMLEQWAQEEQEEKQKNRNKRSEWIARGQKLIPEELWAEWKECIDIRLEDLYNGFEIEWALEIMEAHAAGATSEELANLIKSQKHSGASYAILESILIYFYTKGLEVLQEVNEFETQNKKFSL